MDIVNRSRAPRDNGPPTPMYDDERRPHGAFGSGFNRSLSGPVGIPGAPSHDFPPPPLPPPRIVPVEGPQPNHNDFYDRQRKESQAESSSFFGGRSESNYGSGGFGPSWKSRDGQDDGSEYGRRDSSATMTGTDEGYSSLSSYASSGARSSAPKFHMHDQYQFRSNDSYDSQQLKKLDAKRTLDNKSPPRGSGPSALSSSMRSLRQGSRAHIQLPQLSLPARPKPPSGFDSPRIEAPPYSAVSPRSTNFTQISRPFDYRSPQEPMSAIEFDRSPFSRKARQNSGFLSDAPTPSDTYDHEMEFPLEETDRLGQMHIDEPGRHSRMNSLSYENQLGASLKRRASSPPVEDMTLRSVSSQGDLLRRREGVSRSSPVPRLSVNPPILHPGHGSISSVSSGDRSGSFGCLSAATSMTSSLSFGRHSPVGVSPAGLSPTEVATSPFTTSNSLNRSPRTTALPRTGLHHRVPSNTTNTVSPRKLTDPAIRSGGMGGGKLQDFFMCECCPKKPKKFESAEELAAHEAEKQYECNYCGNRFKNKNEAERHQNSLHVRRHSWSCSALSTYARAFHESTSRPGEADTCGYCGEEFLRSMQSPTGHGRQPTDQDWEERVRHLQDLHKFRECNASKKFFRADHFRQHLKHSHAGTSGKWTNMLENACMLEEEPPLPPGR